MSFFGWFKGKTRNESNKVSREDIALVLERCLRGQIEELERLKVAICFSEITAAYLISLASLSCRGSVGADDVCAAALDLMPPTEEYRHLISGGFQILGMDREANIKLAALCDLSQSEISSGKYEFLVRHSVKRKKQVDAMFEPNSDSSALNFDPRNRAPWSAKELA